MSRSQSRAAWIVLILAFVGSAALVLAEEPTSGKDAKKDRFLPVAPRAEYFRRRDLMAEGMMPNYKALWWGFRHDDANAAQQALAAMTVLGRKVATFTPPSHAGSPEDFRNRAADLVAKLEALSRDYPRLQRSQVSERILVVYSVCQACHDIYAPEEGKDRRKYSAPVD